MKKILKFKYLKKWSEESNSNLNVFLLLNFCSKGYRYIETQHKNKETREDK